MAIMKLPIMKLTNMKSQHGFQLTLQTVIILVVLLLSLVLILFFFTNVFSTTGTQVAQLAGDLGTPTEELAGDENSLGELGKMGDVGADGDNWANPFANQGDES